MKQYYRGHSNIGCYQLTRTNCDTQVTSPVDLSAVTKMELQMLGTLFDSDTDPQAFDWTQNPTQGRLDLKLGLLANVPLGKDTKSELIIYDPSNVEGIVWGLIAVNIIEVQ